MRHTSKALIISTIAFVLVGCSAPSLNGLPESSRVELYGIEGMWYADNMVVHVVAEDDRLYSMHAVGSHAPVQLSFTEIDGQHIADSTINEDHLEKIDPFLTTYMIPIHRFARVELDEDTLRFTELEDDWIRAQPKNKYGGIAKSDGAPVLTGDESQLLAMFKAALEDEDAWDSETVFTRIDEEN